MSENTVDTSQRVVLDYTSRDYKAIRSQLVGLAKGLMPEWQTAGEPGDFGTLLLELFAYASDIMNYYADRVSAEAFLGTASRRQSVMFIADMLGYTPMNQRAATVPLTFTWTWEDGTLNEDPYVISQASVTGNVVTLSLAADVYGISITPGQTIDVEGTGSGQPYNGRFIVESVTPATLGQDFKLTYSVPSTPDATLSPIPANALVRAGLVITIPSTTAVFGRSGDTRVQFETDYTVVLDSANAKDTAPGSKKKTVSAYVTATEGTTIVPKDPIGRSSGIPNAEFVIPNAGVIDNSIVVYTKEGGQVVTWTEAEKISLAGPTQSSFSTYVDDENYTHILFGDNASGRIPPVNAEIFVSYRYGVGALANAIPVNALRSHDSEAANDAGVIVSNTAVPTGGADVESIESIRYSVPRANSRKQRAVTLDDYTSLALQVPGVNKAVAYGANYTTVYVRIASGPESTGYITIPVTGVYINNGTAVVSLEQDTIISPKQVLYLESVADLFDDVDFGSVAADRIYFKTTPVKITNLAATAAAGGDPATVTITTEKAHGFNVGQPIVLSDASVLSPFSGTHVIESRTATTATFQVSSASTSDTALDDDEATVSGAPGFTLSTTQPDSSPLVWTEADPEATATTTDANMQRLVNLVEQYLADKKLIGSVVYAEPVEWTNVDLDIDVVVRPLYNRESVRAAVQTAVASVFSFDSVDFGRRISVGDVYRAALEVDGVEYVVINTMTPTDSGGKSTITNKALSSNVATLTASSAHNYSVGQVVEVTGLGETHFDGTRVITDVTDTTFSFVSLHGNVSSTPVTSGAYVTAKLTEDINSSIPGDPNGDPLNAYRIPRINPSLAEPWVSATGGLANT